MRRSIGEALETLRAERERLGKAIEALEGLLEEAPAAPTPVRSRDADDWPVFGTVAYRVLEELGERGESGLDELASACNKTRAQVSSQLTILRRRGKVERTGHGRYVRVHRLKPGETRGGSTCEGEDGD